MTVLSCSDLGYRVGDAHLLQGITLSVQCGETLGIVGPNGSGKTTLVLETLIPALTAAATGQTLPEHVTAIEAEGIRRANLIDATPIGINVRSTVATYCGALDDVRRAYARTDSAKAAGLKMGDFSYNTGSLRCATCDGTGQISLDVQFLPDVDIGRHARLTRVVIDRRCVIPEGLVVGENAEEDARRFYRTDNGVVLITQDMLNKL